MNLVPMVITREGNSERVADIYSMLLSNRIVYLQGQVTDEMAGVITSSLLYLDQEEEKRDIELYINSPGGSVTAGLAIFDTMNLIKSNVNTTVMGSAASMGAFLLAAGKKRRALPNASIMIHQPLGGYQGQASDIEIHTRQILKIKDRLNELLSKFTGQDIEKVRQDTDRDNYMTAEEALSYGLVDEVVSTDA